MGDLISRGKLFNLLAPVQTLGEAYGIIQGMPTVDAVPVVRCRDCEYWKTVEGVYLSKKVKFCTYHINNQYARHDEDFCSRGERKGDSDE